MNFNNFNFNFNDLNREGFFLNRYLFSNHRVIISLNENYYYR